MSRLYFFIVVVCMTGLTVSAQEKITVMGTVTDEDGIPLLGVNIAVKSSSRGTQTNFDGEYSLETVKGARLVFSYVGYQNQTRTVGEKDEINVVLTGSNELEEVVVVGYGREKKKDLTGAISTTSGEEIAKKNVSELSTGLQGLIPGLTVTTNSSVPGSSSSLRIRGVTTIGESSPLVVVDGIPVESIDEVNPEDVQSISVLKDAASASIYGARGAAGVVVITTKEAKEGLKLEYSSTVGIVKPTELPEMVNYKRYMEMNNEVDWNDGGNIKGNEYPVYDKDYIEDYKANNRFEPEKYPITDWQDELLESQAPFVKQNLSLAYGSENVKIRAALNYNYSGGLYHRKSNEKYSSRINTDIKFNKYISAKINMHYRHAIDKNPTVNPFVSSYKYGSLAIPYWTDGFTAPGRSGSNIWARVNHGGFNNSWKDQFNGRFELNFTPIKNLSISGVVAPSVYKTKAKNFAKKVPYYDRDNREQIAGYITGNEVTSLAESRPDLKSLTKQLIINYDTKISRLHDISLMAGYEDEYRFSESLNASSKQFAVSEFPYLDRAPLDFMQNSGSANEVAYQSFFGRVKYEYNHKYLVQSNVRYDGSSRFAKKHRWGAFPSLSVGWVLTEESFLKKVNSNILSFLKLRASWGSLGNERIGKYPYQSILNFNNGLFFENGGKIVSQTTAAQQKYNIEDITWERTKSWNLGLDVTFFNDRLSLTADYYRKTTDDMLLELAIPEFMGYNFPDQNAGTMKTNGWELQLGWKDSFDDFHYSISAHISDYKSVMGNLSGIVFKGDQIIKEGSQYNEWYGYRSDGLFQSYKEVDESALLTGTEEAGDVKYKDIGGEGGEPDGEISPSDDKTLLGGSLPRYEYGGIINLAYKGFDLSIMFQGVGKKLSRLTENMTYQTTQWYNFPQLIDGNYYSEYNSDEQNKQARFPRLSQKGYEGGNFVMSDHWLIDGSYFRLKNLSLGYSLPKEVISKLKMSNVRVSSTVTNLFSLDHFPKGWDPEASTSAYIARTWTFGLSVNF